MPNAKPKKFGRLVNRARILYIGIPALSVTMLLVLGNFISQDIADDNARRLARQYSIEAAANFQIQMNPHMVLMQQFARSATVGRWMVVEHAPAYRARAFAEIMGFAAFSPHTYVMFTVYDSLQAYNFNTGLTLDQFLPWGSLTEGSPASQWFFDTRDAEKPFILNVQSERVVDDRVHLQVWANHRAYYQNRFVGVVTVGYHFDAMVEAIFGGYDARYMRGYIIDANGAVRIESTGTLQVLDERGMATLPPIPEASLNPALHHAIQRHLALMEGGYFQPGAAHRHEEAIRLSVGAYRYASIAPIVGTDWSVVVLSSHLNVFGGTPYRPVLYLAVGLMVAAILIGSLLVRRFMLIPLYNLTASASAVANAADVPIFGITREDEIGDLARTIQQMRESLQAAMVDMQRIEVAEESNRAKSRFLARMSHEIRTPIAAVLGISEIQIQNPHLSSEVEESFSRIHLAAHTLLNLVNDILDLSKIEAGKLDIMHQEYKTVDLINDAVNLHFAYTGGKEIAFHLSVDENLPTALTGDSLRIAQILNNLLSNAFKYTEKGSVSMSLRSLKAGDGQVVLVIAITDTGLGMTKAQLDALYDEYTRFHEREKRRVAGTGLGMHIVYSLVHMMQADIVLRSQVGKGTTVTVHMPQKVADPKPLGPAQTRRLQQFEKIAHTQKARFTPLPMSYGSVLVVDDLETNLYVAKGLLAFYDLHIETCASGHEAIAKIQQGKVYDLIFMDHTMPGLDGTETMQRLRKMGYTAPIVVLTANALIGQASAFIQSGFDGFISKPIQTPHLNAILNKHIRDKHLPTVSEDALADYQNDPALREKLRQDFAQSQRHTAEALRQALAAGDLVTAHRLAHTLKGLAALIHEAALQEAAQQVEAVLAQKQAPEDEALAALESALAQVLGGIVPAAASGPKRLSKDRALALLDQLAPLLDAKSAECLNLLDELRGVPQMAVLVRQVEEFDFTQARKSLEGLRAGM